LNQGFKKDEFAMLSELLGPKGVAFDNDDILSEIDDEDLKNDQISQIDMRVRWWSCASCADIKTDETFRLI
jgi:importin-9